MKRTGAPLLAVALLLASAAAAVASLGQLTNNTIAITSDSRTFEYGGHISYQVVPGIPPQPDLLDIITHNNSNCGSGQCGIDPDFIVKCRITAGNTNFEGHYFASKILRNGSVENDTAVGPCHHSGSGWVYNPWYQDEGAWYTTSESTWKWRLTIKGSNGASEDSNDVDLDT